MMIRLCFAVTAALWTPALPPAFAAGPGVASPVTSLPDAIPTRQTYFSIPFAIAPPADSSQSPVEVRLYVSADAGDHWELSGRVDPLQKSFAFRAPRDGEYWFAIRTIDRQGQVHPSRSGGPELRVIVDTLPPHLELTAWRAADGQIVVHWIASDQLLKPGTLKVECQAAGDPTWRLIALDPPRDPNGTTYNGQASFRLNGIGTVTLRGEISDQAGNIATTQTSVRDEGPSANTAAGSGSGAANSSGMSSVEKQPAGTTWSSDHVTNQTVGQTIKPSVAGTSASSPPNTSDYASPPHEPGSPSAAKPASSAAGGDHGPMFGPMLSSSDASSGSAGSQSGAFGENHFSVAGFANNSIYTQGLPPGERPYMVNSRRFALDYEVDSAGAAGVSKIEIWGTRDGGRTWQSYGLQPAGRNPIKVKVDSEGLYGFRIAVVDSKGLITGPPHSGDLPELWVGVDLTKPVARITGTELGSGQHAGELTIHYEASDAMLAARPVTLSFTDRAGGPYSTIAAGLENTGGYSWRFDNRVPDQVYLRLEVRDEAGNVGMFETPEPISLQPDRPKGHIRTVHPLDDDSSSRVPQNQVYR